MSLRLRLSLALSLLMLLVCASMAWLSYDKARHEADELLDGQLVMAARLIEAQVHHETTQAPLSSLSKALPQTQLTEVLNRSGQHRYEQVLAFRVWSNTGALLLRSHNTEGLSRPSTLGFSSQAVGDQSWRLFLRASDTGDFFTLVAQPESERHRVALEVATQVTWPGLLSIPVAIFLAVFIVWTALRPLATLTREVRGRSSAQLQSLPTVMVPLEVRPLVDSINDLLHRLEQRLEHERRFTADAAHELRTPIAGLKVQAQVAAATQDPDARAHAIAQVLLGLQRAERLVDQMLRLARLDPLHSLQTQAVALRPLFLGLQDDLAASTKAQKQQLLIDLPQMRMSVQADPQLLEVALRNLLDNASRYSEAGATLVLGARHTHGHTWLYVTNPAQGIDTTELAQLHQRFYRGQSKHQMGSGLGLAITQRIAELHHCQLLLAQTPSHLFQASLGPFTGLLTDEALT
jgi:two-component system sensor histidine kinase QseC